MTEEVIIDTPAPDAPAPDTPAPDAPAPDNSPPPADTPAPAPDTPAPDAPAPDAPPADDKPPVAATWPENWRQEMAKGDEKMLKRLERYNSPLEVAKAFNELNTKLSKGELKSPLSKDATPEQQAEWRKDNGIPEKATDYDLSGLPDGAEVDINNPSIKGYLDQMHGLNATPEQVKAGVAAYVQVQENILAERQLQDEDLARTAQDELRAEWGSEFRANEQRMTNFIAANFPADIKDSIMGGRLADGTPLFSSVPFMRSIAQLARLTNPTNTITPGKGMDTLDSIDDQIKGYEKQMQTNRDAWFKNDKGQQHYRELLNAKERFKR